MHKLIFINTHIMKNPHYLLLGITLFIPLLGCSEASTEDGPILGNIQVNDSALSPQRISKGEATFIASKVLKSATTQTRTLSIPTFEYVINREATRSNAIPDTIAYVLNYPNEQGFVIVASDRRVYPVLAFSNEGHFSFENEIAKTNFIDNIASYISSADPSHSYEVSENAFDGCYKSFPPINICLGQDSPWNKYTSEEHPGCPAGCVAIATALVISHSKYQLSYHNSTYPLRSIITAIEKGQNSNPSNVQKRISGGYPPTLPEYTYEQAVDSMAKIIYWIGKDVNMYYRPTGSGASSYDAFSLCKTLGFEIPSGYADFNLEKIIRYLEDKHIVYLRGYSDELKGGHAWVSDGCMYCFDIDDPSNIYNMYIRCDWGWNGACNGYYSGAVFDLGNFTYKPLNYFAIKREWYPSDENF